MTDPTIQTGPDGTPTQTGLNVAMRIYIQRWTDWMQAHPDADPALISRLMGAGEPPPGDSKGDETAVTQWEKDHPVASEIYWIIRAELAQKDGKKKAHHHRVAMLFIHSSFRSKPERARLGLPATNLELAELLGVSDRTLRTYRESYPEIFEATRQTIQSSTLSYYYGRVYEAMGETAIIVGREGTGDRRLLAQIWGDLGPSGGEDDPLNVNTAVTYIKENRPTPNEADDD